MGLKDYKEIGNLGFILSSVELFTALDKNNNSVLIKRLDKSGHALAVTKFRSAAETQQNLNSEFLLKPSKIIDDEQFCFAVLPYNHTSQTLADWIKNQPHSLLAKLKVAANLCALVADFHQHQFILRSLTPEKILVDHDYQVKLIDISLISKVNIINKKLTLGHLEQSQLATISPEATGRTNRAVEQRSDLYSLGAVLYKLFTLHYPFESDDEIEMVHAHIAKQAQPANELNPNVPAQLASIINKLLSKSPEQRYLSILGLQSDMERCFEEYKQDNKISSFQLSQQDYSDRIHFSSKLFGRDQEMATLLGAFAKTVKEKSKQLFVISGYSGVGKSRLVQEVYKEVIEQQAYFITGKFDQYKKK